MAVPIITDVSPSKGLTAGQLLVTITGSGFRLPDPPPPTGKTSPPPPSVAVRFGNEPALKVWVVSDSSMLVLAPPNDPGRTSITVHNLADGVPIPGEGVTVANAFEYKRPDLTVSSTLERVVRVLLREVRRQVLDNTAITTHTDYDSTPGDLLRIVELSKLPALVFIGPRLAENRPQSTNVSPWIERDGAFYRQRPALTVDLSFTVAGASDNTVELLNLASLLAGFVQRTPYLSVAVNDTPNSDRVRFEFAFAPGGQPQVATAENLSNLRHFTSEVVVRGVDVQDGDMSIEKSVALQDYQAPGSIEAPRPYIDWLISQIGLED